MNPLTYQHQQIYTYNVTFRNTFQAPRWQPERSHVRTISNRENRSQHIYAYEASRAEHQNRPT